MPESFMKVLWFCLLAAVLCSAASSPTILPVGTALPVAVNSTLNAKSAKPGEKLEGKLKQEVRLPSGIVIKKGSRVDGKVVSVQGPLRITVQFTELQNEGRTIPLNVTLRALAATESVFAADLPVGNVPDQANEWVTQQVGGDYVFRGRGYVSSNMGKVGLYNGDGVWGKLAAGGDCIANDDNGAMQALWIFSGSACGTYGFKDLSIAHDGSAPPMGQITLESNKDILVRGGSGWLLLVNPAK
jgi:hypothetical protein